MFSQGQCIIGCVPFKDGSRSLYRRPYLIVGVDTHHEELHILNISSVAGKEHKLKLKTNVKLLKSMPPLTQESFVKIDSCQKISFTDAEKFTLLGTKMDDTDFSAVLQAYLKYNSAK